MFNLDELNSFKIYNFRYFLQQFTLKNNNNNNTLVYNIAVQKLISFQLLPYQFFDTAN